MNVATRLIASQHDDFVHDVAYDYYGKRLATCSSDEKIKVWEQDPSGGGKWLCQAEWKAHRGPVWKLDWAHPEYGQIIASCSFDQNCYIWEEHDGVGKKGEAKVRWAKKAQLGDARESVNDCKFSPRHMGLKLVTASADGFVRIYEAVDVMNLSHWPLQQEFEADSEGVTCVSWNTSRFDAPMLLVGGCGEASNVKVRHAHILVYLPDHYDQVWGYNTDYNKWEVYAELNGHTGVVHDVAWAPSVGRSYHLLASASKDRTLRVWKLTNEGGRVKGHSVATKTEHNAEVWRVQWNVTGSVLASSGDDGIVRLWKQDLRGEWKCITEMYGDSEGAGGEVVADASAPAPAAVSGAGAGAGAGAGSAGGRLA